MATAGALLLLASTTSAQTPTVQPPAAAVLLSPPAAPRWDIAGHVAYFTLNQSALALDWNNWSDTAAAGASAGYYVTRQLKLEADLSTSGHGDVYSQHFVTVPGSSAPLWFQRRHVFQTAELGSGLRYQFFDNRWVHPFAGGGIEAVRQRESIESPDPTAPLRLPPGSVIPAGGPTVTWLARPYLETGAKFYVSENAFIRTDLRSGFDRHGVAAVTWRTGIGFDF
jgi:hypothetical protein